MFWRRRGDEQAWLVWQRLEPYANVHVWLPPGTHSGRPVVWIDDWFEDHPANLVQRADRHIRRLFRDVDRHKRRSGREA